MPTVKRSDAERNRTKILDAARDAFTDPDADVSMAEVARRAGVGPATLYRNFANKRELLEALYIDEVDAVVAAADELDFIPWLRRFFSYFNSKRPVAAELLADAGERSHVFGAGRPRVFAAAEPLLQRAKDAGEIKPDLTLEQIMHLVTAVANIPGDPAYVEPILDSALDGLKPLT